MKCAYGVCPCLDGCPEGCYVAAQEREPGEFDRDEDGAYEDYRQAEVDRG